MAAKKILLVNPGHDNEHSSNHKSNRAVHRDPPPLGLMRVGTFLQKHGYDVEILDTHVEADWRNILLYRVMHNTYTYIGITTIIGKFMKNAAEIVSMIKSCNYGVKIIFGGPMASAFPEECIIEYNVDGVVVGEGEETALKVAYSIDSPALYDSPISIGSYVFRDRFGIGHGLEGNTRRTADTWPIPNWKLLGDRFNMEQNPYFHLIMTSTGCPFSCSFCYNNHKQWTARSVGHVMSEIDYIHKETGSRVFTLGDDNFLLQEDRAKRILQEFKNRGFYIEECIGHINNLTTDLMNVMAGTVKTFIFSVESASPYVQNILNKKINVNSIVSKVESLADRNIACNISFMLGIPGERPWDVEQSFEMMKQIRRAHQFARCNCYLYLPIPGTDLYESTLHTVYKGRGRYPENIREYEDANFWMREDPESKGLKFRPYLSESLYQFLLSTGIKINQSFRDSTKGSPYVLDEILEEYKDD